VFEFKNIVEVKPKFYHSTMQGPASAIRCEVLGCCSRGGLPRLKQLIEAKHPDSRLNRIDRILIPPRYTFFSESTPAKNSGVKHAWPEAISGWATDWEVFPGVHK
jgi:hypothetical protein